MSDLFPVPFPDDVKIVELDPLSLASLSTFARFARTRGYHIDDERGVELLRDVVECAHLMKRLLPAMPVEEKRTYKRRDLVGVYSMGYKTFDVLPNEQPKYTETI
ncbi:hypothetical protein K449DRAFT_399119 [Hypoxylon sp. EC38]|nr:hypothetical protein K449DRAFT_399119 [Hypoxylon sp. EC38]